MKYLKFKINSFINSLKKIFLTKKKTKKKSLQLHFLQIINNIKICNNCTIGVGAVVTKSITIPGNYAGIPAKKLKKLSKN